MNTFLYDSPMVTIGITCYNAEETIERAIRSALEQTWKNSEVLVVDDASTDHSVSVVQAQIREDIRFRVLTTEENRGVAAARNRIVSEAEGEFIAFFDDDDISDPLRIEKQLERSIACELELGTKTVICHTARLQVFPGGEQYYAPTIGTGEINALPFGVAVADQMLIGRPLPEPVAACPTCSQMARRAVYLKQGGFNESLRRSEDTDFNVRFALSGGYFAGISEPLVTQTMTFTSEKRVEEERYFAHQWLKNHQPYLDKIGWYRHAIEWLDIKFDYLSGHRKRFILRSLLLFFKFPVHTVKRLIWAWPNREHSRKVSDWHGEHYGSP